MTNHQQIRELMPWFVNGTLNEAEQSLVHQHLLTCTTCKKEVEELVQLSAQFGWPNDGIEPQESHRLASADFIASLPERHQTLPTWMIAGVAASVIVVAVAIAFLLPAGPVYQTLSSDQAAPADTSVIQVVFRENATERVIRNTLYENDNVVLSGPSRLGVYRVAVSDNEGAVYIARLANNPDVIFVQLESHP